MKNWTAMTGAAEWNIPAAELERVAGTLDALEESFRPLIKDLSPDIEPATFFRADEEIA